MIFPVRPNAEPWRFKAEVMAELRSIEQVYWELVVQHSQLRAREKAVELAVEVLKWEQAELLRELNCRGGIVADLAEAEQRVEQFRRDVKTKNSDLIATERRLRVLLGLPSADDRRIVPSTAPTETKVELKWDACLAEMLEKQPDIVVQRALVASSEKARPAAVEREKEFLEQVIQQTTRSLTRFFHEIDGDYEQFQKASTHRALAVERFGAQRRYYDEGRITIDKYLDAVSRLTSALSDEAQAKAAYNISLVALEEVKGSLLEARKIVVAKPPSTRLEIGRATGIRVEPIAPRAQAP